MRDRIPYLAPLIRTPTSRPYLAPPVLSSPSYHPYFAGLALPSYAWLPSCHPSKGWRCPHRSASRLAASHCAAPPSLGRPRSRWSTVRAPSLPWPCATPTRCWSGRHCHLLLWLLTADS
eukprot:scaffold112422_cov34-Phaeocystis_antarctica.AAC.2